MAAMATILDFPSKRFLPFFIYKSTLYLIQSFESLAQEKRFKIDFQADGHLGLLIETIFASFDLYVAMILPTKF